uniref:Uncharacterized protein n=1 Tax=Oryza sativa subsp. japonica TaxID=39947 RepID=Q69U67_ORYSJ|nr:hypothetical protein [Oryza sativa Japonica Group]
MRLTIGAPGGPRRDGPTCSRMAHRGPCARRGLARLAGLTRSSRVGTDVAPTWQPRGPARGERRDRPGDGRQAAARVGGAAARRGGRKGDHRREGKGDADSIPRLGCGRNWTEAADFDGGHRRRAKGGKHAGREWGQFVVAGASLGLWEIVLGVGWGGETLREAGDGEARCGEGRNAAGEGEGSGDQSGGSTALAERRRKAARKGTPATEEAAALGERSWPEKRWRWGFEGKEPMRAVKGSSAGGLAVKWRQTGTGGAGADGSGDQAVGHHGARARSSWHGRISNSGGRKSAPCENGDGVDALDGEGGGSSGGNQTAGARAGAVKESELARSVKRRRGSDTGSGREREKKGKKGAWSLAIMRRGRVRRRRRGRAAASPTLGRVRRGVAGGPWMTSAMMAAVGLSWSGGKAVARGVGGARTDGGGVRPVGHLASERARDAGVRPDFERRRREIGAEEREIEREREKQRERGRGRESERTLSLLGSRGCIARARGGRRTAEGGNGLGRGVRPIELGGGKLDFHREN